MEYASYQQIESQFQRKYDNEAPLKEFGRKQENRY